jgi:hypothetical protein
MINKIFLDLDGVVRDWIKGINRLFKTDLCHSEIVNWDYVTNRVMKERGISEKEFWESQDEDFWIGLEFTRDAKGIFDIIGEANIETCLLTAPTLTNAGYSQQWIKKNMPWYYNNKKYLMGPCKYMVAQPNALLIDDAEKNIDPWIKYGGIGFLWPQPWNRNREHIDKRLEQLKLVLS